MHQGHKAEELREARGWTQGQLRDKLQQVTGRDISRPAISQMEDREWLEGKLINDLARVYAVSPATFFDIPTPAEETREEVIARAFEYVRSDPKIQMSGAQMRRWPSDAKLAIVRLYENYTGKRLVPEGIL